MEVCRRNREAILRLLPERKVCINIQNKENETAMMVASKLGLEKVVDVLLNSKAMTSLKGAVSRYMK